jgi:fibronectin-binding autotransporter adhesin
VLALSNANALSNSVLQLNVDGNRIAFVLPGATDYRLGGLRGTSTNLVIGSNSLTLGKNGETNTSFGGVISGSGGLTKVGSSTQTLTGANIFTGATTVSAGTLELASLTGSAAGSVTSVSVSSGATLLVSQSNQVNNNATVTLSGGTITRGSGVTEVFGSLNLTQSSFLDFGTGTAGALTFGTYTPSVLLTINNFGLGNTLVFGSDLTSTINNSSFFTFTNGGIASSSWNGSTFTITAIPETSTYVAALALLALMLWPLRHRDFSNAAHQQHPSRKGRVFCFRASSRGRACVLPQAAARLRTCGTSP